MRALGQTSWVCSTGPPCVIPRPAASASLGNLLEMPMIKLPPAHLGQGSVGEVWRLRADKLYRWSWCESHRMHSAHIRGWGDELPLLELLLQFRWCIQQLRTLGCCFQWTMFPEYLQFQWRVLAESQFREIVPVLPSLTLDMITWALTLGKKKSLFLKLSQNLLPRIKIHIFPN